ncbi:SDR family NAD(P)-dependent oxidoreductase [Microbacterium sp. zg.Y1090]|uniref:SDR family NAD(P)-dependent oxidoreductase n=1 Tax=Microbacterium TaxID=33882 RepID=UPI00214C89CC|nr:MULTISPECIES: SDR family NAD(P)-dependent oxidoreductase [unclassified Microbacterium]MCR2813392.1 SDR family NAD(P)-dependent oxidoreductase [Microbacterium sp. zg.Y1084]MCR2818272.1 SDR family NAD(P)-dependent oxidoreductase [Microbacterium sp. zg.Y1090]WIM27583.1 SDR family NAD(P)-dependent oxidoreductase [Microbacterium sp. zg-Y1090]
MAKTALITGASSGLGAEYARQLAERGMDLVLVARDADALAALADDLTGVHGVQCEALPADLVDADGLARVVARLSDDDRPVDMLVNNAGFGLPLAFEQNDIADEQRHLDLHVAVPMALMRAALPGMLARGRGRIVNVASVAAFTPRSTYGAVKGWLISFSRWANVAYRPRGVSVTAVCPGFTHTSFHERMGMEPGREGVPGWMWLDARDVVAESLRDVARGTSVSVPSLRYKVLVALTRVLPDRLVVATASKGR